MACANIDMDIRGEVEPRRVPLKELPRMEHYEATEVVPDEEELLHDVLLKKSALLGTLQMACGLLSVGVGIIFAVTQEMEQSLFVMFRVSHLSGAVFTIAGLVSNLLFKYPGLLLVSLALNCGGLIIALAAVCLISIDLASLNQAKEVLKMELLELCVLGLEFIFSVILCSWISKVKRSKSS